MPKRKDYIGWDEYFMFIAGCGDYLHVVHSVYIFLPLNIYHFTSFSVCLQQRPYRIWYFL